MSTNHSRADKRNDRINITDTELDALKDRAGDAIAGRDVIGIDGDGAIHFFSMTSRHIAVFESVADTDPRIFDAEELADPVLRSWAIHVARDRGRWADLRLNYQTGQRLEVDR